MPQTDPATDEQTHLPPAWPEPRPPLADQPWTLPGDDGTPYDWLAAPEPGVLATGSDVLEPPGVLPAAGSDVLEPPGSDAPTPFGGLPPSPAPDIPPPSGSPSGPGVPSSGGFPASTGAEATPEGSLSPAPGVPPAPDGWSWTSPVPDGGLAAPVPSDDPLPDSPETPSWQPPPAFTAAAAGMHVWPSPASGAPGTPPWPAATGEPVGETAWPDLDEGPRPGEPGDVPVWPPDLLADEPDGDQDTVRVRVPSPAAPDHREPSPATPLGSDPAPWAAESSSEAGPAPQPPDAAPQTGDPVRAEPPAPDTAVPGAPSDSGMATPGVPPLPGTAAPTPPAESPVPGTATPDAPFGSGPAAPAPPAEPPSAFPLESAPSVPSSVAEPGLPAPSPDRVMADHPTPPGGIPVVSPSALIPPAAPGNPPSVPFPPASPGGHQPLPVPPAVVDRPPVSFPSASPGGPPPASGAGTPGGERGPFQPASALGPEPAAPPSRPPAPPARSRGRGRTVLIAAAVAIVVGGIGAGAFLAYPSFDAGPAAEQTTTGPAAGGEPEVSPSDEPGTPAPANTALLDSELTDPGRMTVADAFSKKVTIGGTRFTRVKTHITQDCDKAAAGAFAAALRTGDCRRVLRATYVDSKKRYAVTTGVAVLPTRESAVTADQAKNLEKNLWFRGLPGTPGTGAERVHIAGGYAAGLVWGRYIVFSYATFVDGHTPTAKEKGLGKVSGAFRDQTAKAVERRVTR
ncbi:hypothetical protein HS041_08275 [Planomonospora sp. ID67723]|uniref:hypothetical protein n=1 Tax=Planomonospora sp. ID67723 TaxID=2738134 RepID=UPI0018C43039|nr:hypothetical protein [Planomonospora sp. ID67723]MBG0827758.1 hypothetical protein [Planomonospora sp. ID67723]